MTNSMPDPISIGEKLGTKDEKTLFLIAIVVIIVGGVFFIRWLIKWNERTTAKMEVDRDKYNASMENLTTKSINAQIELAKIIERNTEALTNFNERKA